MKYRHTLLSLMLIYFLAIINVKAQEAVLNDTQQKQIKSLSLTDYATFKKSAAPLVKKMAANKIVGLGEGTHGTGEFYKLRFFITRMLIEDYGFNHVAFENDVTEVWQFNRELTTTKDLDGIMKKYLLSLWQNQQTREFFSWIQRYNTKAKNKISIDGIDYPSQTPDVDMISMLLSESNEKGFEQILERLYASAKFQDEAWRGTNEKNYQLDFKKLTTSSVKGYVLADSLNTLFKNSVKPYQAELLLALENLKQGFEPFYKVQPENARDSIMAANVAQLVKSNRDKIVIWAHNGHLGKVGIYNNMVGGTGGHLLKHFPNNYFALGTSTAIGTFAGTTDARAVNDSQLKAYPLEKPIENSWEAIFSSASMPNFYFDTKAFNPEKVSKPLRFVGYGIKSGKTSYDDTNLSDIFDVIIFLKETNAPTPLQ